MFTRRGTVRKRDGTAGSWDVGLWDQGSRDLGLQDQGSQNLGLWDEG